MGKIMDASELLISRRSIRKYEKEAVPQETLWSVFELCRFAPTSMNTDSCYYIVIRDKKILDTLSAIRGESSAPISRAPMAVAVCTDPAKTRRVHEDGCIAAYHFLLSAWTHRLGTCWIGGMDREEVKNLLGISQEHYVVTVTPLGFPAETPDIPPRPKKEDIVRFLG